ncbi:PKD domain-containing protein, partial [Bacteroidales bacterium AH-315-N07]|nr:PKD domain-containing protein [Bacteroidales bacterium AH-315-N07]
MFRFEVSGNSMIFAIFLVSFFFANKLSGQIIGNFSSDTKVGCLPLIVNFTDQSTGSPTSWNWDFGNGNSSTKQNPSVNYIYAGVYSITLIASSSAFSDTITKIAYISVFANPISSFSGDTLKGCSPFTTNFTDESVPVSSSIKEWYWDFGDGYFSTNPDASHTFSLSGLYTISLLVIDGNGCQDFTFTEKYVKVNDPDAGFQTPSLTCEIPADVMFINNFTSDSISYFWDFGDGTKGSLPNPTHSYASLDTFSVTSMVIDELGCTDTSIQDVFLSPFKADFTFILSIICDSIIEAEFTDISLPYAKSWLWDFGNGFNSSKQNPEYTYDSVGNYYVTLISKINSECTDTITREIYDPPKAIFTVDTDYTCRVPFDVTFKNLSTGIEPITYFWDFGGQDTITIKDSTFFKTYTDGNTNIWPAKLFVTNSYGCIDSMIDTIFVNLPVALFNVFDSLDGYSGCIPVEVEFSDKSTSDKPIISRIWDFGDGDSSSLENPSHTYNDTGRYKVDLLIINELGCSSLASKQEYIRAGIVPDFIYFDIEQDTFCHHRIIQFSDSAGFIDTTLKIDFRCWNFHYSPFMAKIDPEDYDICPFPGEESFDVHYTTAIIQNPAHDYDHYGTSLYPFDTMTITKYRPVFYEDTVNFIACYNGCCDTIFKPVYIHPPTAMPGFIFLGELMDIFPKDITLASCSEPITLGIFNGSLQYNELLYMYILNEQTGDTIKNWTTSTDTSFITFNRAGSYLINISVRNDTTGCVDTRHRRIRVDSVHNGFTIDPEIDCLKGNAITFADTSTSFFGTITHWLWEFGDGDTLFNGEYGDTVKYKIRISGNESIIKSDNNDGYTSGYYNNPIHSYRDTGTYIVKCQITVNVNYNLTGISKPDNYYCIYETIDTVRIEGIKANFGADTNLICAFKDLQFIDSSKTSTLISSYEWNFRDSSVLDTNQNPQHSFDKEGEYGVILVVNDQSGCADTVGKFISVHHPNANFSSSDTNACQGLGATFTNETISDSSTYIWDFGDGEQDASKNPVHSFDTTGEYAITLYATDTFGCTDTLTKPNFINVLQKPQALFQADITSADCPPLPVRFTDNSIDAVSWIWYFGDGQSSKLQNPSHIYISSDSFDVMLIAKNTIGCPDTINKDNYINILGPSGSFTFDPDSGCLPINVNFISNTKNADYYFWGFGDGNIEFLTSAEAGDSTSHSYEQTGSFTPSLFLKDITGCTFIIPSTRTLYIEVLFADFNYSYKDYCDLDILYFSDTISSAFPTQLQWAFGDSTGDTVRNPNHIYNRTGNYVVQLKVTNATDSTCFIIKTDTIKVFSPPNIKVLWDSIGCIPLKVALKADTVSTITNISLWKWDFGDGTTGTGKSVNHTYLNADSFTVKLSAYYANDSCKIDTNLIIITLNVPDADFTFDPAKPSIKNPIIDFSDLSAFATTWLWDFGTGDTDNSKDPVYTYENSGH